MPESLYEGKTPIWACRHYLTLSENVVAGQEADLGRVVIVPWHLRPSALLSTSGDPGQIVQATLGYLWAWEAAAASHRAVGQQDLQTGRIFGTMGKGSYPYH